MGCAGTVEQMNRRVGLVGLLLGLVVGCGDEAAGGSGAGAGAAGGSAGSSSNGGSSGSGGTEATGGAGVGAANPAGGSSGDGGSRPGPGSAGCGTAHEAGFTCFDETFEGNARSFCVEVPEGFDPSVQRRVVLGLHGCGGSPQGARSNTAPQVTAGQSDLLFVYPKALASCWDYNMTAIDVSYVQHVLERVAGEYCIDESRTFADGMSSGAMMSSRLLCDGIVDGAAAISLNYSCGAPHPVWLYGGTADEYYASYILPGRDGWIAANGCSNETVPLPEGPCVEYQGCSERTIWCSDDRGHVWPTDPWTTQIVDFFRTL
jgi:polyhydroxybutyrate depolymerase